jgi:predicted metal-binding transcription factor (methanogenesis marker protein 9)
MLAFDYQSSRVQSMSWQKQVALELCGPSTLDEPQVKLFVRSVNLVAHNGMTNGSEVHSDLVRAARVWNRAD